ncbi:response regulator transcription factor [Paenibacillus sp. J5C_2022]|uniref:response regulator transcription factor n=1 Tax=Paenibacillus sp. J5C2022 TaxID=2977129 RepID=UPI0021D32546|nr:response regulator transcription factor [Paenibacillus sp. J5C2022]MCU6710550.1 response regulator transcription factor [Paenibacillus sp. J5C2022]
MTQPHILIVDNEKDIRQLLKVHLYNAGMQTLEASSGREALAALRQASVHLVILDLMMQDMNGWEALHRMRASGHDMPVIVLSARGMNADKIEVLGMGADDYVTKPFSIGELVARVQANLRRHPAPEPKSTITIGELTYDTVTQQVHKPSGTVSLSPLEGDLLQLLIQEPGRVFTKKEISQGVWKLDRMDTNTVNVYINYLRKKIEDHPSRPRYIETIRGLGYRFNGEQP